MGSCNNRQFNYTFIIIVITVAIIITIIIIITITIINATMIYLLIVSGDPLERLHAAYSLDKIKLSRLSQNIFSLLSYI